MADSIHTLFQSFERVELPEHEYQDLLRSHAGRLFPGYRWFTFNAPVESPFGVAHPDAALVGDSGDKWWVVEVEISRHSVAEHVDMQLRKLAEGWYGRAHFESIVRRHPTAGALLEGLSAARPDFLVIVDDRSTIIERSARENGFDLLHVLPFRSIDPTLPTMYATCMEGRGPGHRTRKGTGVPVLLAEKTPGVAQLEVAREETTLPAAIDVALVGNRLVRVWLKADRRTVVLALSVAELHAILGEGPAYWLTTDPHEPVRLSTIEH